MNKKVILLFLLTSSFLYGETLRAQIRSDFILADSAVGSSIRLDGEGNLHAVWKNSGGERHAYYAVYDSGGHSILAPVRVSVTNNIWVPRLALSEGHAVVVWWLRGTLDNSKIRANVLDLGKEIVARDISIAEDDTYSPDVAYLDDSTFIVVWIGEGSSPQSDFQIYGQISTNSVEDHQGGHILLDDPAEGGVDQFSLRVIARPDRDDFLIVWRDDRSGSFRVYGRLFNSDGSAVDLPFLISEDPQLTWVGELSVAMNESREFAVVWSGEINSMEWVVQTRRLGVDGRPLGPSIRVDSFGLDALFTDYPDIAYNRDGTFIVVWDRFKNGISKIYAQRFNPDWTPLGGNFRVSSVMDSSYEYFASVMLRDERIYTVWSSKSDSTADKVLANIIDFYDPPEVEDQSEPLLPLAFSLHQNYPNPFNPMTNIRYSLPEQSNVTLTIYNIIGEEIRRFSATGKQPGDHEFVWDASDVASGVYLYRLQAGLTSRGFVATRKMILLK